MAQTDYDYSPAEQALINMAEERNDGIDPTVLTIGFAPQYNDMLPETYRISEFLPIDGHLGDGPEHLPTRLSHGDLTLEADA